MTSSRKCSRCGVLLGLITLQSNGKVSTIQLNAVEVTPTSIFVQSFVNHQAKKAGIEKLVKSMEHTNITVKPKSKRHGNNRYCGAHL